MTEEFIYEREQDLLDYFRNNIDDPEKRGVLFTDSLTATQDQTVFYLSNIYVKNVSETITLNSVVLRKGYDFYVTYGEGKNVTKITLYTAADEDDLLTVEYYFGPSMIEREYSRSDAKLPRIVMMFLTGSEEYAGLGDLLEFGRGSYFNASYVFEIRAKYASQARELASKAFNVGRQIRHANLFRTLITRVSDMKNFDFDREKDAYIWQFTLDIQWDSVFE